MKSNNLFQYQKIKKTSKIYILLIISDSTYSTGVSGSGSGSTSSTQT